MIYGYAAGDMMLCKDIVIPEITPAIAAEMLQYGKASGMRMLLECAFIEGYYNGKTGTEDELRLLCTDNGRADEEICARDFKMTGG